MTDLTRIKKLLSNSTTMPAGTGIGKAAPGQPQTALNMHARSGHTHGPGCGCTHSHDNEDED